MEVVGPDEFIELAEVAGLIHPLTRWAVKTGVAQCGRWRAPGLDINVSVNISARNFADGELIDTIANALTDASVPPDRLVLEITESQLMSDPVAALAPDLDAVGAACQQDRESIAKGFGARHSGCIRNHRSGIAGLGRGDQRQGLVRVHAQ